MTSDLPDARTSGAAVASSDERFRSAHLVLAWATVVGVDAAAPVRP